MTRIEQFFDAIVGNEERVAALRSRLAQSLGKLATRGVDPYRALQLLLVDQSLETYFDLSGGNINAGDGKANWKSVLINGEFGTHVTLAALSGVGDIYQSRATVPQQSRRVEASVDKTLRHVYGIAISDQEAGATTIGAMMLGLDPHDPVQAMISSFVISVKAEANTPVRMSPDAFSVESDKAGQLTIAPRYDKVLGTPGHRCPAVDVKVAGTGHQRSGLLTFMQTIGSVVVSEIYPNQFPIDFSDQPAQP